MIKIAPAITWKITHVMRLNCPFRAKASRKRNTVEGNGLETIKKFLRGSSPDPEAGGNGTFHIFPHWRKILWASSGKEISFGPRYNRWTACWYEGLVCSNFRMHVNRAGWLVFQKNFVYDWGPEWGVW